MTTACICLRSWRSAGIIGSGRGRHKRWQQHRDSVTFCTYAGFHGSTVPRGVFVQNARKSRGQQRQNALKTHFVRIAKRVIVRGQKDREQYQIALYPLDIITVYRYDIRIRKARGMSTTMINELLKKQNMSIYRLSQNSKIPYMTLNDICTGKTRLEKCSAETVYRLAKELHISMEDLLAPCFEKRCSFELFKSNVCHQLKELGDIDFLIETLKTDAVRAYYQKKWYPESLYLLAMVDYISRLNNVCLCEDYNDLRRQKLSDIIYPASVLALCAAWKSDAPKRQARKEAIPEFMRFNIVESEIRNVN